MADASQARSAGLVVIAVMLAPFFLNDFAFIASDTAEQWLAADYGSKILPLVLIAAVPALRRAAWASLALRHPWPAAAFLAVIAALVIIAIDQGIQAAGDALPDHWVLFTYPGVESPALYWIDLTFGLVLTAVAEEIVFRGVMKDVLARYLTGTAAMVLASAVIFAAIHWSHGLQALIFTFVAGVILMALYLRTGSLIPCMAAHYAVNAVDFL